MARDGRCWTTTKHLLWLRAALLFYLAALPNNTLNKYLRPTYEQWFIDFPEPQAKLEDYRDLGNVESESDSEFENEPPSDNDERAASAMCKRKGKPVQASRKKKKCKVSNIILCVPQLLSVL